MTLNPTQISKILSGIPNKFGDLTVPKVFSSQHGNLSDYPAIIIGIPSEGMPVIAAQPIGSYLNPNLTLRTEVWGEILKARISLVIETLDLSQLWDLKSKISDELCASELGINPIIDRMQFRGLDPPANQSSYKDPKGKLVQSCAIQFFVEYQHIWKRYYDVITEVRIETPEGVYYRSKRVLPYSLDVIIEEQEEEE